MLRINTIKRNNVGIILYEKKLSIYVLNFIKINSGYETYNSFFTHDKFAFFFAAIPARK